MQIEDDRIKGNKDRAHRKQTWESSSCNHDIFFCAIQDWLSCLIGADQSILAYHLATVVDPKSSSGRLADVNAGKSLVQ